MPKEINCHLENKNAIHNLQSYKWPFKAILRFLPPSMIFSYCQFFQKFFQDFFKIFHRFFKNLPRIFQGSRNNSEFTQIFWGFFEDCFQNYPRVKIFQDFSELFPAFLRIFVSFFYGFFSWFFQNFHKACQGFPKKS
jgi:hypothetical protein